ncbi:uncharacterized protein LOC115179502 isoform X8 [Salmo trutta]|uniref:uncharacterized protein LOC115179502 isoform X8 n=1 Tax=Salmo trutta TaxID=8032 RepID=UPI00113159C1|nr:uncharacterized protein LOC115179502 isoform X8 [Salmo trutta]
MASVKLEDCSQTLELNVNIKDEEEEEKIGKSLSHGRLRSSLRPVTSTVRTDPACLSSSTLSPNLQSLGPDCDSGAQFALQDPEMASVKLEDCSQTLELNVNIKDEEEEEKIGTSVSHVVEQEVPGRRQNCVVKTIYFMSVSHVLPQVCNSTFKLCNIEIACHNVLGNTSFMVLSRLVKVLRVTFVSSRVSLTIL